MMRRAFCSTPTERGFTLTELLITMAITGVIMGAIVSTFVVQRRSYAVQGQITDMMQNARVAMDMLVREARMTGYGVPRSQLSTWIDWVEGFTSNPQIVAGKAPLSDKLSIALSFDAARLSAVANVGDTTLTLSADRALDDIFNAKTKKVIYIGRNESAVVTKVLKNTITIDTDPTTSGPDGLRWNYPADTPVELLKVVTYDIVGTTLRRNENTDDSAQPLAENIEDFRVTSTGNSLTLSLIGRTTNPDTKYTHPTYKDHYRRIELSSRVRLRNLGL
jgi:prepilin-type N-terminal cleavage/methylation domain-containing protein